MEIDSRLAVKVLRHVVQDHGDGETILEAKRSAEDFRWLGGLLRLKFPEPFLEIISVHNGVWVDGLPLFGILPEHRFLDSFQSYVVNREVWEERQYWPVADDGCGNNYVLDLRQKDPPVAFIEGVQAGPTYWVASSYPHFVFFHMIAICSKHGCESFAKKAGWPFDREFVLKYDPALDRIQPQDRWPK